MTNPDLFNDIDPDELLRSAAMAARRAIPLLMLRLKELESEAAGIRSKLMRLNQVAALLDKEEPEHLEKANERRLRELRNAIVHGGPVNLPSPAELPMPLAETDADPQALSDIKRALFEIKEPMRVPEIIEYIKKMSEREWGSSTIYNHLNKGKAAGVFANANNKWSLTEQGQLEMIA
jgi:hypothetical protein